MVIKIFAVANFIFGVLNIGVAIASDAPKLITLVCIGVNFFVAGLLFGDDD